LYGSSIRVCNTTGGSIAAAARELGISREWASKIANAPETQQIIASLAQAHAERIYDLFAEALKVIQQAFRARRRALRKGEVVDLGPDHVVGRYVRSEPNRHRPV
jgi:cobalamin biosynthesis protein CbiD